MERMGGKEEWLRNIVAEGTRKHHQRAMRRFVAFMSMSPEEILRVRRAQFGKSKQLETKVRRLSFYCLIDLTSVW